MFTKNILYDRIWGGLQGRSLTAEISEDETTADAEEPSTKHRDNSSGLNFLLKSKNMFMHLLRYQNATETGDKWRLFIGMVQKNATMFLPTLSEAG